jgi:hypothetical protein
MLIALLTFLSPIIIFAFYFLSKKIYIICEQEVGKDMGVSGLCRVCTMAWGYPMSI